MSSGRSIAAACLSSRTPSGRTSAGYPAAANACRAAGDVPRPHQQPPAPVALQLVHVQLLQQAALVDDADAVRQAGDLGQDVAGHEDRHALFAGQLEQQLADLDDPGRVQAVGRLVQQEQLGVVQQRLGQPQALGVALREGAGPPVGVFGQPQALDDLARRLLAACRDAGGGRPPGSRGRSARGRRAGISTR